MKRKTLSILLFIAIITFSCTNESVIHEEDGKQYYFKNSSEINSPYKLVAEFDQMQGVLITFSDFYLEYDPNMEITDQLIQNSFGLPIQLIRDLVVDTKVYFLIEKEDYIPYLEQYFEKNNVILDNDEFFIAPEDSYWTRDYGPWFTYQNDYGIKILNHQYNRIAFNSKGEEMPEMYKRLKDDKVPLRFGEQFGFGNIELPLLHVGGNFMTDGINTSFQTDLLYNENKRYKDYQYSKEQVDEILAKYLGTQENILLKDIYGKGKNQHIDCWAKLIDVDKLMIIKFPELKAFEKSNVILKDVIAEINELKTSYGTSYKIFRVEAPHNQPYTNSLILNNTVYIPLSGNYKDEDKAAIEAYETALPGYTVKGYVNKTENPWYSTDALHCRTKEIAMKDYFKVEIDSIYKNTDDKSLVFDYRIFYNDFSSLNGESKKLLVNYLKNNVDMEKSGLYINIDGKWELISLENSEISTFDIDTLKISFKLMNIKDKKNVKFFFKYVYNNNTYSYPRFGKENYRSFTK